MHNIRERMLTECMDKIRTFFSSQACYVEATFLNATVQTLVPDLPPNVNDG